MSKAADKDTPFRQSRRFVIGAALFAIGYAGALAAAILWATR